MSECYCNLREKLVGDGCEVCNPAKALEYAKETIEELTQRCDLLLMALERIAKHQEAVSAPFSDNSTAGSIARAAIAAVEGEKNG